MTAQRLASIPVHTLVADQREELEAHRQEALALVDECWPIVSALEVAAIELGPRARHLVLRLGRLLSSYEARHLPDDPDPAEAVAA